MKNTLDKLLDLLIVIGTIFAYSIALKLTLGIIWILGDLYIWFGDLHWVIQVIISVIVGLILIRWRDKFVWDKITNKKLK